MEEALDDEVAATENGAPTQISANMDKRIPIAIVVGQLCSKPFEKDIHGKVGRLAFCHVSSPPQKIALTGRAHKGQGGQVVSSSWVRYGRRWMQYGPLLWPSEKTH